MGVLTQQVAMVEDYFATQWPIAISQAQSMKHINQDITHVYIGGCGDSHHAALGMELAFGVYTGRQTYAMEAMRLARYAPSLSGSVGNPESCLVIGISASGEVARTIEALEIWGEAGADTLAFTTNPESTLARVADQALILPPPDIPHGPGLLSYLGSLLLGYAVVATTLEGSGRKRFEELIIELSRLLPGWIQAEGERSAQFAHEVREAAVVFLGSGPPHGSARFGAAKVIEAAGENAWAQDIEEWAHLEYFCEPASMPTMLLSAGGRSLSRENEIIEAMAALGRNVYLSKWQGGRDWRVHEREVFSPLALWAAPCAYAGSRASILGELPFRDFGGGRDRREGGGPSRIRSSQRLGLDLIG